MIATLTEVKKLLQITDTTKDDVLTALMPVVQDFICSYTNNNFEVIRGNGFYDIYHKTLANKDYYLESYNISFVAAADDEPCKILNSDSKFVTAGFIVNAHVKVTGSVLNDGFYKITGVAAGELQLEENTLLDESNTDNYIRLSVVSFPTALKVPFANMLAYELNKQAKQGINSESLGDYSASYTGEYPKSLLAQLSTFRRIKTVC